jgi:hypothetical protein
MLHVQQPKSGWLGVSFTPKQRRPTLIVRQVDEKSVRDPRLPAGQALPPGAHRITLSVQRKAITALAKKGLRGLVPNSALNGLETNVPSRHDRTLAIQAQAGHAYVAHLKKRSDSYDYWIEDDTTGDVVASTRH